MGTNTPTHGGNRVQGYPAGIGDPVQVTLTDADGSDVIFSPRPLIIPANAETYSAPFSGYAAYATPTDLFSILGSATKTIAIINFAICIQSTAAALQTLDIIRRSTASTGGTETVLTPTLYDTDQDAATAVAKTWTTAPGALGASAGIVKTVLGSSSTLTTGPTVIGINYTNHNAPSPLSADDLRRPIILRGVAESLNFNYRGAALTAGFLASGFVEWIEF
jgi:hypothetical protein